MIDGTGNPWRHADVAVAMGKIAAVGNLRGQLAKIVHSYDKDAEAVWNANFEEG